MTITRPAERRFIKSWLRYGQEFARVSISNGTIYIVPYPKHIERFREKIPILLMLGYSVHE